MEAQNFLIETGGPLGVPDIQDGMVESVNWHVVALLTDYVHVNLIEGSNIPLC